MSVHRCYFSTIRIDRFLGVRSERAFAIDGMVPGINVIYGPNGVGKSTTAKALIEALWPGQQGIARPTLQAAVHLHDDEWTVDIDAGYATWYCDAREEPAPDLGAAVHHDRYRISIEQLIFEEGGGFAKQIANECRGGFDLEQLTESLRPHTRSPRTIVSELRKADTALARAKQTQRTIQNDADRLSELSRLRDEAIAAQARKTLLQAVQKYHAADRQAESLRVQLESFPTQMRFLRGGEDAQLRQFDEQIERIQTAIEGEEQRRQEAAQGKEATHLQETLTQPFKVELKAKLSRLRTLRADVQRHQDQLRELNARVESHRRRLTDAGLTAEQRSRLSKIEVPGVSALVRRMQREQALALRLNEQRQWLERVRVDDAPASVDELVEAAGCLARWLSTPSVSDVFWRSWSWPAITASSLLAAGSIAGAILVHPAWAAGLTVPVGLLTWEWLTVKRHATEVVSETLQAHQQAYLATGLASPREWSHRTIQQVWRELRKAIAKGSIEQEVRERIGRLEADRQTLEMHQAESRQRMSNLRRKIGVQVEVTDDWLPIFIGEVNEWYGAATKRQYLRSEYEATLSEYESYLVAIQRDLVAFGYPEHDEVEAIEAAIEDLLERDATFAKLDGQYVSATQRLENSLYPDLTQTQTHRAELLDRVGLTEQTATELPGLCERLPAYRQTCEDYQRYCTERDHLGAGIVDKSLLNMPIDSVTQEIESLTMLAEKRDTYAEEIGGINERIREAKQGTTLSEAIANRDEQRDKLCAARRQSRELAVANVLLDELRTKSLELTGSRVYERARQLLHQFTRGRLQLEVEDRDASPTFRVRTSVGTIPLQQLSLGERVQTMIAVRLAFVEQDEVVPLPIMIDEALATSDPARAHQIMEAVISVAESGRQVIYFTADTGEVGDWSRLLSESAVSHALIDLGQIRKQAGYAASPLPESAELSHSVPPPHGMSRREYGHRLNVPGVSHFATHPEQVHLWHVVENLDLLYELLCHGISNWWQLQQVIRREDTRGLQADDQAIASVASRYKAIRVGLAAASIGRGTPVNRDALLDSGAVSEVFMDDVMELVQRHRGDAAAIIDSLAARDVPRWRSTSTDALREFFTDHGYLRHETPLSPGEIALRIKSALEEDLRSGRISEATIEEVTAEITAEITAENTVSRSEVSI